MPDSRWNFALPLGALMAACALCSVATWADTVDAGNIATFEDGQAALADDVNGNFSELIEQINDHASRLDGVETSGLFLGDDVVTVDCNTDGADALQDAIDSVNSTLGTLIVLASGACSELRVARRGVIILGTDLSITADSSNPRVPGAAMEVLASDMRLVSGQDSSFLDIRGNGESSALVLNQDAQVLLAGVSITGATELQAAVSGHSSLAFLGANTIGTAGDGATGLRALQSRVLLLTSDGFLNSTLNINSSGVGIEAVSSTFSTLELSPGTTQLAIPNAVELDFSHSSVGIFGPMTFGDGSERKIRISDNSTIRMEGSSLYDAGASGSIMANLQLDRGAMLYLNFEEAPTDASFVHQGNAEIGINSAVDGFGPSGTASVITFAGGDGSTVDVNLNSTLVLNSATFSADLLNVLNGSATFAPGSAFDDGQPAINVSYDGTVIDLGSIFTGDVACETGGTAYSGLADACPSPP